MGAPTYPPVLREAIASAAGSGFITNPMPESPPGGNAASIQDGFPPETMTSELAGGKPPLGQDMNGFLFLLSSHLVYIQSGLPYLFDTDVATALGGYPVGTLLGMADGSGVWINTAANNTTNPDGGAGFANGWRPEYSYGISTITTTGGASTATDAQAKKSVIVINGALTSNATISLPQVAQEWLIVNNTTGAFAVSLNAGGGSPISVPQGGPASPLGVYSLGDGNLYPTVAPLSIPISQAATPLSIAQRTNAGYLLAVYFNQSSGDNENPPIGQVFVENTSGDGYLRKAGIGYFETQLIISNLAGQLVNGQVPYSVVQQWASTFFANAALTGVPTAPTAAPGTNSTQIATTAFVNQGGSISGNGWRQNPDGTIEQWGSFAWTANGGNTAIAFPRVFPNALYSLVVGLPLAPSGLGGAGSYQASVDVQSASGFTYHSVSSSNPAITVNWWAIGK